MPSCFVPLASPILTGLHSRPKQRFSRTTAEGSAPVLASEAGSLSVRSEVVSRSRCSFSNVMTDGVPWLVCIAPWPRSEWTGCGDDR